MGGAGVQAGAARLSTFCSVFFRGASPGPPGWRRFGRFAD